MLAYYYYDPTYPLVIIAAIVALIAQLKVNSTFKKYSKVAALKGMTGAQVCDMLLKGQGIYDVSILKVGGNLTDHYDPFNKELKLSDDVYDSTSVAAIGVAAHECGHAIQHAEGYLFLTIRSSIVPVVNIASYASWIMILLGLWFSGDTGDALLNFGIMAFVAVVAFHLITLPVELNASRRALRLLGDTQILYQDELKQTKKVLSAAAMTYVAALATAVIQLLRLVIIAGGRSRD